MSADFSIHPTGKCFDDALDLLSDLVKDSPRKSLNHMLAHGILKFKDGKLYSHAWVENETECMDFGIIKGGVNDGERCMYVVDRAEYYRERDVIELTYYTIEQAAQWNMLTNNFGPWLPKYRALCKDVKAVRSIR